MRTKSLLLIAFVVTVGFVFGAPDMVMAQDCNDGWWDSCETYNRPVPLMDYVPQYVGTYDTYFGNLAADDCRACHGDRNAGAIRHQFSALAFAACPDGCPLPSPDCLTACHADPNNPETITYNCLTVGCHSDADPPGGPHHHSDLTVSYQCTACHQPDLLVEIGSEALPATYPTALTPTPYDCENCHWQSDATLGPPTWPIPIGINAGTHKMHYSTPITGGTCHACHSIDPYQSGWSLSDPVQIRYCQKCHSKDTLHATHSEDVWGWEAVGFHASGDPNGVPDTYRLFTAEEACVACHHQMPTTTPSASPEAPAIIGLNPTHHASTCTISGENFGTSGNVLLTPKIGQTGQTQTVPSTNPNCSWADNQIVVDLSTLSLDRGNYYVRVETAHGMSNTRVFTLTGAAPPCIPCPTQVPQISSVDPPAGVPNVGVLVTIEGQHFGDRRTSARELQIAGYDWSQLVYSWTDTSVKFWLKPFTIASGDYTLGVVTENGNSNQVAFTIDEYPSVGDVNPTSGLCDTWITLTPSSGQSFQAQQSKMLPDGYGVHHVADFVGPDGTHTAINYRNWSSTSLEVSFGDVFEDQIDPATGERNYAQDDGSGPCANEPTVTDCNSMLADMYIYMVYLKVIYYKDEDSSSDLSCGDTIVQVETSHPYYFYLAENDPDINILRPRHQEPTVPYLNMAQWLGQNLYGDPNAITPPRWGKVGLYGNYFGPDRLPDDEVRIGDPRLAAPIELQYNTDADPYTVETIDGGVSLTVGLWSNDLVGVYLYPEPGEYLYALYGPNVGLHWLDTWLGVWVVKDRLGSPVASNVQPIKVLTPLPD